MVNAAAARLLEKIRAAGAPVPEGATFARTYSGPTVAPMAQWGYSSGMTEIAGQATEYGISELVEGEWMPLPHAGSWYTDRWYANDLTGRAAAEAAIARVGAAVPSTYRVTEIRTFVRTRIARQVL